MGSCRSKSAGLKQSSPLQIGKGVVDLGLFIVEEVLVVHKIQLTLKNKDTEFLWVRTIKWIGFLELGLGCGRMGLDKFIDSHDKSESFCFFRIHCHSWSLIGSFIICGINVCRFGLCRLVCRLVW